VRAIVERATTICDADEVVVAVAPHHALVLTAPHVPGTRTLADLLDIDVSDDASCAASSVAGSGVERPVPPLPVLDRSLTTYREHEELVIGDVVVDWWVTDDGERRFRLDKFMDIARTVMARRGREPGAAECARLSALHGAGAG